VAFKIREHQKHIDKLSAFHGLSLFFFVACDSGTLQYLLLIHISFRSPYIFFVPLLRGSASTKSFRTVLYARVMPHGWWEYIYSLATASSAESANTDLPIRHYVDFAARSVL
jgi:hypothetical protein